MKTILAFGDSLTWGADPASGGRHPIDDQWPVALDATLGAGFRVIAEGLNGRTTCYDDHSGPCDRNGTRALPVCLASHSPLDLVVIMLGTNDLKPALCGVTEGATVHLSVKIRGGGGDEEPGPAVAPAPAHGGSGVAKAADGANAFVSAFAPPSISPGKRFRLDIWAYVREQMEHAVAQNRKKGRVQVEQKGPLFLRYGEVKIRLDLPEEAFVSEETEDSFVWEGEYSNAQFRVSCLSAAPPGEHDCSAQLWADGKKVSVLYFELAVGESSIGHDMDPAQLAAWTMAASGVLSSDAAIVKD